MRQPRRCLRGCRPRVTRTPSRVQATARSNTRTLRRRPPGLTRVESACSRQMGMESAYDRAPCQSRSQPRIPAFSRLHPPATRPASAWPLATLTKTLFSAHGCRSRIHRMRFAGNTLEASCCRTFRFRCVARRLWWLLAAADHASLLPRATRVSAPARHPPRRAPTAAVPPSRGGGQQPGC